LNILRQIEKAPVELLGVNLRRRATRRIHGLRTR
jgi:hypothetical protein